MKLRLDFPVVLLVGVVSMVGCGSSGSGGSGSGGSGGTLGSGGNTGSGGSAKGGSGGNGATGGGGGSSATGGSRSTGGATGTGGAAATGGTTGTGGAVATGGTTGSGGAAATGGASGSGGAGAGGGGKAGSGGAGGVGAAGGGTGGSAGSGVAVAKPSFDWVGVVGSGQSLSVGTTPAALTTQPYNNLMLALNGATVPGTGSNPWDPGVAGLTMVPLIEPVRALETAYPSPYPGNIYGETPHSAMANEITRFVKAASASADYVTVHTIVGESGQGVVALVKEAAGADTGTTGRAYAATIFEAGAITKLANAAGKSYGVGVVVMTHGETDCSNATYGDSLVQILSDYNTDISAITGQSYKIPMYLSQQHGCPGAPACTAETDVRPTANDFEWQLGVQHPGDFVCTGPKYQYPAHSDGDGIHLNVTGYELLGEKTAEIYYQRAVLGQNWQPLAPTGVSRNGRVVTVQFHVPVEPLNWDTTFDAPKITAWANGKGFELFTATSSTVTTSSTYVTISSVAISGDSVQITAGADLPTTGLYVAYALTNQGKQSSNHSKAVRWGQLRDSDPFMGGTTKQANPNYAVSFSMPVP
jgi:hypothetical protein